MISLANAAFWSAEDTLQYLKASLPAGWKLTFRHESGYAAELSDESGECVWAASNLDPKYLGLEGLGYLLARTRRPSHPTWKPREHEVELHELNPRSDDPDPPDLDPQEVEAVYRAARRKPP